MADIAIDLPRARGPVPMANLPNAPRPAPLLPSGVVWAASSSGRRSPLVIAAGPVLELCAEMKAGRQVRQAEQVHREAFRAIRQFETRAATLGLAPKAMKASKYVLCATLDDIAMNSTWGSRSVWTSRSLVGAHFSETWGGDRVFDLLDQMRSDARGNVELLELIYCCLSLGFEGRYRISARGAGEMQILREDLYRLIRSVRGPVETDLAVRWKGVDVPSDAGRLRVPLLATALAAAGLLLALLALLWLLFNPSLQKVWDLAGAIPPAGPVTLKRDPVTALVLLPADRLRGFLEPEIREGLVTVSEDDNSIKVTIRGDGMFDSAAAEPRPAFLPLLQRIGRALDAETGAVTIEGHTDSQAIRSPEFPSNDALSLARAEAVRAVIGGQMGDPNRLGVEGRGAAAPMATNDTPEGRALNRRTEVILFKEAR
ncbi:type VI secretion system protein TssL, long form [Falsirhodobacter sp. 1013]|uniref:type VI secretion system protein TssL, long form n=1 Tax=Falsirhodobacter sp. 1013 TaxID=3417566 RepID=UPI003EB84471